MELEEQVKREEEEKMNSSFLVVNRTKTDEEKIMPQASLSPILERNDTVENKSYLLKDINSFNQHKKSST